MAQSVRLHAYLFSFNRGLYLRNAAHSIARHCPGWSITVIDDGSDDEHTIKILDELRSFCEVLVSTRPEDGRLGGLYRNMQYALDLASDDEICLFIQDDMQFVRPFRERDLDYIVEYFSHFFSAAFLYPVFIKGDIVARGGSNFSVRPDFPAYEWKDAVGNVGHTYSDILMVKVDRARGSGWTFASSEAANAEKALCLFGPMGIMRDPIVMYLPEVPVYRSRSMTLASRVIKLMGGIKFCSFVDLIGTHESRLLDRSLSELPIAETFLETSSPVKQKPYVYSNIDASNVFLKKLHYWELRLRRFLSRKWR